MSLGWGGQWVSEMVLKIMIKMMVLKPASKFLLHARYQEPIRGDLLTTNSWHSHPDACQQTVCPVWQIYQLMKLLNRLGGNTMGPFHRRGNGGLERENHRGGKQIWDLLSPELACLLLFLHIYVFMVKILIW